MHAEKNGANANPGTNGNGALVRWARVPLVNQRTLAILGPDGKVEILPDCVTAAEAAQLLGCSLRCMQEMCERGALVEGRDWRKIWATGSRGRYRISREAVLRIREGLSSPES